MKIEALRRRAGREEIDYPFLISALKDYARPREKISAWLKSGQLIRVKKGLYLFGQTAAQTPYSKELLANLIYGPSAISLTYALSFYGLIPEKAVTLTSITPKRNKLFKTPVGYFQYFYLHPKKYPVGILLEKTIENKTFMIASPEKALCDQMHIVDQRIKPENIHEMESYLFQDLRIDEILLKKFKINRLSEINVAYQDDNIILLIQLIKQNPKYQLINI